MKTTASTLNSINSISTLVTNAYEKKFVELLGEAWLGATPGLRVQVYEKGKKKADLAWGQVYDFYDWASLTKIVFSVPMIMRLFEQKVLALDTDLRLVLPWTQKAAHYFTARELLTHSAGMRWWYEFYKKIPQSSESREKKWDFLEKLLATIVQEDLQERAKKYSSNKNIIIKNVKINKDENLKSKTKSKNNIKSVYSDIDFLLLGSVIQRLTKKNFLELWKELQDEWQMDSTHFHAGNRPVYALSRYAPTELCPWRGRVLKGEVHDENTWALGGVAPHAGLFGPIDDLSRWGLLLRSFQLSRDKKTQELFMKRARPRALGDWALGFTMPSRPISSSGRFFGQRSIGHLGFTGTSLWWDPHRDLLVTVLSNRVHPTRENKGIQELRRRIHDVAVKSL